MTLSGLLSAYGSVLILPLSVVEGPVVSVAAGFLSAQGYFGCWLAMLLLVAGDLIGDLIYYGIGRSGGGGGGLGAPARWAGVRRRISPDTQRALRENATKMLLIGKWTHSIGFVVLIGSGMLRIPLRKFVLINLLAALPKIAVLFGFGYFAGGHYRFFERHWVAAALLLAAAGVGGLALVLRHDQGRLARRSGP